MSVGEPQLATFELDRFVVADGRLEVAGRWRGVRGRRFVRPTLSALAPGAPPRALADLEHKPWAPEGDAQWVAAFPWARPLEEIEAFELAVANDLAVRLGPPSPAGEPPRDPAERAAPIAVEPPAQPSFRVTAKPAAPRPASPPRPADGEVIGARDRALAACDEAIAERDRALEERQRALSERDRAREELDRTTRELDRTADARERAATQRERAVEQREQAMLQREQLATAGIAPAGVEPAAAPLPPIVRRRRIAMPVEATGDWRTRLLALAAVLAALLVLLVVLLGGR